MLPEPLIAELRRATAARHAELETLLGLDTAFDLPTYGKVLGGFDAFLTNWEPRVAQALPVGMRGWFLARCRGAMVRCDLEALSLARMPDRQWDEPAFSNVSAAMGSLYVLEGSALGGQVIARQVARQHGLDSTNGAAYFNGWGASTGAMWREFQQVLQQHDEGGGDREAACAAADATFQSLAIQFRRALHEPASAAA